MKGFSIAVFFVFAVAVFAVNDRSFETRLETVSGTEMSLEFILDDIIISEVTKNGTTYSQINFGGVTTNEKGYAELPMLGETLQIGEDYDIKIMSADGQYEEIKLDHPLLPSRGTIYRNQNPESIPYEIDTKSVVDDWYPKKLAENAETFILRDIRGVNIYVYPIQYNAEKRIVRIYKKLTLTITEDYSKSTNPLRVKPDYVDPSMNELYRSLFKNYKESKFTNQLGEFGEMLVIYTSRDASVILPYITWKREKGFKVSTSQVATGTNVKTTIQNAYASNPNLLYVQLVGDWADIKCDTGGGASAPLDPYLGCVAGSDYYPELIIGRFSANSTTEVTTQVNKTIAYEKTPDMAGTWYKNALGIASNEGPGDDNEYDYQHMNVILDSKLLTYTYSNSDRIYNNSGSTAMRSQITNDLNGSGNLSGTGMINYAGHGSETSFVSSGFSNTDINSLTNGSKLPFIFSVACVNGAFHTTTCFGETWLRKSGGGAVATIMSTINQPWIPPMRGQDYMNDILRGGYTYSGAQTGTSTTSADRRTTFGSVTFNGAILMLAQDYNSTDTRNTIQTWTIFGDASLQIRTDTPKALTVSNTSVAAGTAFSTNVKAAGANFKDALVSIYQNGNTYAGFTDVSGNVTINHGCVNGSAKLVVSGYNTETRYLDITVGGTGVVNPSNMTASTAGQTQINLGWTKNASNNNVMVAFNTTNTFGTPSGTYSAGQAISGGGTVIYRSSGTSHSHTSLSPGTTYFYKAWSYDGSNVYSSGITAQGSTTSATVTLPLTQNFNASTSLPSGWTIVDNQGGGQVWQIGTHASGLGGTPGNYAYLNSDAYGSGKTQNSDLVTPLIDCSGATSVTLAFTHYFRFYSPSSATVSYSINGGSSWTAIQTWAADTSNPASFSQVISSVAGQANVKFKWNYTGTYGYYWDVDDISITAVSIPAVPTLASPSNGSSTANLKPVFDWNDVSNATSYTILADNNSDFSSPEISQSPTTSTYTPASNLAAGTYYWKVKANNAAGSSAYTTAWTVNLTLASPVLASPSNGSLTTNLKPVFDWSDVTGATSYTIMADNNSDFSSPEINQSPTASTYTPASNLAAGTYYWKVKANNATGSSAYTAAWTVTLQTSGGVALPVTADFTVAALPSGWANVDNQGGGQIWQFGTHASGLSGTGNYAYLNSDAYGSGKTQNADLVTPLINCSGESSVTLSFTHFFRSYTGSSGTLSYSINGGSTWTTLQTLTASTTNPATFSQVISGAAGQANVKFKWNYTGTYGYYWDVDNISITGGSGTVPAVPALATPSNGSSTTNLKPVFDWNDVSGATSYTILADNNSDFSSPEINQSPTSSTYTPPSNLATGTYYWKVKANNATGSSAYSSAWTLTLSSTSTPVTLLSTNFPSTTLPTGWSIVDNQGGGQVWKIGTHTSGLGGTPGNYAYLNSDAYGSGKTQNSDLVTPVINCSGKTSITLAFKHYFKFYTGSSAKLYYSINGGSTWTLIQTWTASSTNPASFSQVITAAAGQTNVKFKWNFTGTWGYYWDVDDISVTGMSAREPLSSPKEIITRVKGEDLVLEWEAVGGAESYDIYSSDDPEGKFILEASTANTIYTSTYTSSRRFYYIVAKNSEE
jgi:hypothetical protein